MFKLLKYKYLSIAREAEWNAKRNEKAISLLDSIESEDNVVVDTDLQNGWFLHGSTDGSLSEESQRAMQISAYKLYHDNTYARAIIRNLVKFVLGKGPRIIPKDEHKKKELKDTWNKFKKKNKFNLKEKEICSRLFRDGDVFLRFFTDEVETGDIKMRFMRSTRIRNPTNKQNLPSTVTHGIQTAENDVEEVIRYFLCDDEGNLIDRVEAEDVIHLKIFCDSDQKRGISIFRVAAKRLKQYEEWLLDRIVLNKVRSAIALVRTVSGPSSSVKSIRDENLSSRRPSSKQKLSMPNRGSIITASKGIDYNMLSPNIQAADVKDDGRAMLLSVAAGVGFPEMIFTADFSNANYASSLTAMNPFIREIEDWQDYFVSFYEELFERVVDAAIKAGKLPANVNKECEVEFPPIIQADLEKLTKAFEILYKYRIVSRKTWRGKMNLDDEQEKLNIENEDAEDGGIPGNIPGQSPIAGMPMPGGGKLNMPISPINQYGSKLMQALRDQDWQELNKLSQEIIEWEKEQSVEEE